MKYDIPKLESEHQRLCEDSSPQNWLYTTVKNNPDYVPYFITVTFKNNFLRLPQECFSNFFNLVVRKINKSIMSHSSKKKALHSILMLVPENSYQRECRHMSSSTHYHGFLLIHKRCQERFETQCLMKYAFKKDTFKFCKPVKDYPLIEISRASKSSKRKAIPKKLEIDSEELTLMRSLEDVHRTAGYATKNLLFRPYTNDESILFFKTSTNV